jgi:DNA repair exonuclease SbcCD nuclease subunit
MTRILHLSDLHFGDSHFYNQNPDSKEPTLASAVTLALKNAKIDKVDHLLITGDVFSKDPPSDALHAREILLELMKKMNLTTTDVSVVPGNHDLSWDKKLAHIKLRSFEDLVDQISSTPGKYPAVVVVRGDVPVVLSLLDSCRMEGPHRPGIGRVTESQLEELKAKLGDKSLPNNAIHLTALHHHLLPIAAETIVWESVDDPAGGELKSASLTVDAVSVLRELAASDVVAFLHGHQHQPSIMRFEHLLDVDEPKPVYVIAAGSAASKAENGESIERGFYLYDISRTRINVQRFVQQGNDARRLKHDGKIIELPIPTPLRTHEVCSAHVDVFHEHPPFDADGRTDSSDLNFLLLTVLDCAKSRKAIRKLFEGTDQEAAWANLGARYVRLEGMYDLLGKWDLLVKFRCDPAVSSVNVESMIRQQLEDCSMIQETGPFSTIDLIDVRGEYGTFADAADRRANSKIRRNIVGGPNTDDYEKFRCQRALVYVELPPGPDRASCIGELSVAITGASQVEAVVESVCVADRALLINTFMRCAQSLSINKLNRSIEKTLTKYRQQKYTLLFYGYDESELERRLPSSAA